MNSAIQRILAVNLACMSGATMFFYLNAYLLQEGLDERAVGLCDSGFWLISVLLQPWLGPRLDTRGRIFFLRLGVAFLVLAALGYVFAPVTMWTIFPLRVLQGLGFSLYLTSAWAWLTDHCPADKIHTVFGIFGVSSLAGSIVGPILAHVVRGPKPHMDWYAFAGAGAMMSLALLILFTLGDAPREPVSKDGTAAESLASLARRQVLRGPIVGSLSFGLAVGSLFAFAAPYLESLGIESAHVLIVVLTVVAGVGRGSCGPLSRRFGSSRLITPCLLSLALGSAGLGSLSLFTTPPITMMMGAGVVAGIGYGLVYPLLNALAYERLSASERGRGMSLIAGCIDSGNAIGAALAGFLAAQFEYGPMFLTMAALVVVTALVSRLLDARSGAKPFVTPVEDLVAQDSDSGITRADEV